MQNQDPKKDIFYRLYKSVIAAYKIAGVALVAVAFGALVFGSSPDMFYYVDAQAVSADNKSLAQFSNSASRLRPELTRSYKISVKANDSKNLASARRLPPIDKNLSTQTRLIIPKIGIDAFLFTGENGELELDKGVWMAPNFGSPTDALPMLISAHRFGGLSWNQAYRDKNSFRRLPELTAGDEITVIYQQRKFTYRVTNQFTAMGYEINSATENLVLYTCKYLRSPERIFVTAVNAW